MIYLDNAATTLQKPSVVAEAVARSFSQIGNAGRGANTASLFTSRLIYQTRKQIADFFHMKDGVHNTAAERVVFTMNATEGLNIVLKGLLEKGDHVVTTNLEHNSVLRPLYEMEERGVELTVVCCEKNGRVAPDTLEQAICDRTKAVVCTHASNVTGAVNDIEKIGEICKKHGIYLIVDASQTAGICEIEMDAWGISALIFTGHKGLMGPQGTGGICLADGVQVRPLLSGGSGIHSFERRHPEELPTALEAGTLNGHGIAGLHAALEWLGEAGLSGIEEKERQLSELFIKRIERIPGIRIYGREYPENVTEHGNGMQQKCTGTVSCNIACLDSAFVSAELDENHQIATRPGAHCAPLIHCYYGTKEQGMVRFGFSVMNTEEEAECAAKALAKIAADNRGNVRAYVGAGGKTGSIYRRAEKLAVQGKRVLILTTTKMLVPGEHFIEAPYGFSESEKEQGAVVCNPAYTAYEKKVDKQLATHGICVTGYRIPGTEKFGELPRKWMENLLYLADEVLIEADGAAHKAAKVPGDNEPVLYPFLDEVVVLMGAHALGHRVDEACHRSERVREILRCGPEHILTEEDLWTLMQEGYEKPISRQYPGIRILKRIAEAPQAEQMSGR